MYDTIVTPAEIVVVGAGMVAHRFVESLLSRAQTPLHVTVIGDEGRRPYDRIGLPRIASGGAAEDLELDRSVFDDFRVRFLDDDRALRIDRAARTVMTRSRVVVPYDTLVLATGSYTPRFAVEGADLPGCFSDRTIDDVEALAQFAAGRRRSLGRRLRAAVVGRGSHGAELAAALHDIDVVSTLVEHSESRISHLVPEESGAVGAVRFDDGETEAVDLVVLSAHPRPRDELARNANLQVAERGGVVIDDRCTTSDPHILAIGEVARFDGRCVPRVAPGYAMAEVAASRVLGGDAVFLGFDQPFSGSRTPGHDDPTAGEESTAVIVIGELAESGMLRLASSRIANGVG